MSNTVRLKNNPCSTETMKIPDWKYLIENRANFLRAIMLMIACTQLDRGCDMERLQWCRSAVVWNFAVTGHDTMLRDRWQVVYFTKSLSKYRIGSNTLTLSHFHSFSEQEILTLVIEKPIPSLWIIILYSILSPLLSLLIIIIKSF